MKQNIIFWSFLSFFASVCVLSGTSQRSFAAEPVKIIFDTDIGNDIDDVLALALLHNFQSRGECELLAATITKDNPYAAPCLSLFNAFYNRPEIPIGVVTNSGVETFDGQYLKQILEKTDENGQRCFPFFNASEKVDYPDAVTLLRQLLAQNDDQSIVIVQVGFSTNLARLLDSPADEISPLTGRELLAKKVRFVSVMAGAFTHELEKHTEYNVVKDVPAAQKFFTESPVPLVFSGYEIGKDILMTGKVMSRNFNYLPHHPVKDSYAFYRGLENDQCTWDLTSVLYAVRPDDGYFHASEKGFVHVRQDGTTWFEPNDRGNATILSVDNEQILRIQEAFFWLCSEKF